MSLLSSLELMVEPGDFTLPPDLTFEDAMQRLEAIVKTLEGDTCTLEDALNHHAEGVALARFCKERLRSAELKVQNLTLGD